MQNSVGMQDSRIAYKSSTALVIALWVPPGLFFWHTAELSLPTATESPDLRLSLFILAEENAVISTTCDRNNFLAAFNSNCFKFLSFELAIGKAKLSPVLQNGRVVLPSAGSTKAAWASLSLSRAHWCMEDGAYITKYATCEDTAIVCE